MTFTKGAVEKYQFRFGEEDVVCIDGEYYGMVFEDDIDEICKEFTEENI